MRVDSEKAAIIVIKKLNQKRFKNKVVKVRKYEIRTVHNDPRFRYPTDEIKDKRIADRRLVSNLEIHDAEKLSRRATRLQMLNMNAVMVTNDNYQKNVI